MVMRKIEMMAPPSMLLLGWVTHLGMRKVEMMAPPSMLLRCSITLAIT